MYVSHFLRSSEQIVLVRAHAIREAVTVHNRFIRSDVGGIEASDSATALLRSIMLARKETIVPRIRSGSAPVRPHYESTTVAGFVEALLVAADFTTVKTVRDRTEITEFHHCLPHLKGSDAGKSGTYTVAVSSWIRQPWVCVLITEKKSAGHQQTLVQATRYEPLLQ